MAISRSGLSVAMDGTLWGSARLEGRRRTGHLLDTHMFKAPRDSRILAEFLEEDKAAEAEGRIKREKNERDKRGQTAGMKKSKGRSALSRAGQAATAVPGNGRG